MPKTIKNIFDKKLEYINLYNAHIRASKNKRHKDEVMLFEMDLETNISNLMLHFTTDGSFIQPANRCGIEKKQ